ncbi:hypothetical protein BJV82DRAFT_146099 [Fennellomyces sp. T-0311]|nr:hypothetical protein BJV82DRAFT_146099 [Fennellomyces sp. T-0311]
MAVPTAQHQHANNHKKCTSASCCSRSKIWKAIQAAIAADDKKGLAIMFQDEERVAHFTDVLLKERNNNDASALPPSHKHRILQFDKPIRPEALAKFGKSVTDLNALQVALFHQREGIACQLLQFLRQHATPSELQAFIGHVWGEGNSSLHLACFHSMPRLVQMLLDLGADPNSTNAKEQTPANCCKDPDCLAALEKVTDNPDSSPPPVTGRRASAVLLSSPTRATGVSLKRQASLPGLKSAKPSVEKKPKPITVAKVPTIRSIPPQQQQQPIKAPAKSGTLVASLLHDNKARNPGSDKMLPTPVMRRSSALRPTPETERPVTEPPADPPAAAQQQQKQQQKQAATAPTVTADPIKERQLQEATDPPQHPSNHGVSSSSPQSPTTGGVATVDATPPTRVPVKPSVHPVSPSSLPTLGLPGGGEQSLNHPPNPSGGGHPQLSSLPSASVMKHGGDTPSFGISNTNPQKNHQGNIPTPTTVQETSHGTTRTDQAALDPDDPSDAATLADIAFSIQHLANVFTVKGILEQSIKQWTDEAISMNADPHHQHANYQSCSAGVMHSLTGDSQITRGQIAVL